MDELFVCGQGQPLDLYIMRGIPGCGKSNRAARLKVSLESAGWTAHHFSADAFFGEGEEYKRNWSSQRVHLGHRDCEAKCLAAMKSPVKPQAIIIDNVNLVLQNFRFYIDNALDFGYAVHLIYPDSPWWTETVLPFLRNKKANDEASIRQAGEIAKLLFEKNVHGVPEASLVDMLGRFQWVTYNDYVEATRQRVLAIEKELAEMQKRLTWLEKHK